MKHLSALVVALVISVPKYGTVGTFSVSGQLSTTTTTVATKHYSSSAKNAAFEPVIQSENSDLSKNVEKIDEDTSGNLERLTTIFESTNFDKSGSSSGENDIITQVAIEKLNFLTSSAQNYTWEQKETGFVAGITTLSGVVSQFSRSPRNNDNSEENVENGVISGVGVIENFTTKMLSKIENFTVVATPVFKNFSNENFAIAEEIKDDAALKILRTDATVFDDFTNTSDLCQKLKCMHASKCATDGSFAWCKCSWAHTGSLCESALPLYLVLGLIGAGILIICLLCLNVMLCSKLVLKKKMQKSDPLDRKLRYVEAFNKTDSTAIYADPTNYYGSSTNIRTTSTLPRPRLNLESFENDEKTKNGHVANGVIVEQQNGHYQTFQRHKAAHPEACNRL